jgi:biotin carboxyl carrier protein
VQPTVRIARRHRTAFALLAVVVAAAAATGCGVADRASLDPSAGAADGPTPGLRQAVSPAVSSREVPDHAPADHAPADHAPAGHAPAEAGPTRQAEGATARATRQPPRVQRHDRAVFARSRSIAFHLPSPLVEHIGYHQSGHDGALRLRPLDTPAPVTVLDSRGRGTGRRTAADIVVHPRSWITAPVTGTVVAANPYVLYCVHRDELVFIAPDERPDWTVKVLHLRGVKVAVGDRVEAGATRIARRARVLPFESQVDAVTQSPPWPHVHVEMIDPSVPDRPTPGPGCP